MTAWRTSRVAQRAISASIAFQKQSMRARERALTFGRNKTMHPMELFTDDGTFSGRGYVTGEVGARQGRFMCEAEPRGSAVLAGPLAIRLDESILRISPLDQRLGGFWGLELSFEELCEPDQCISDPSN